MKLGIGARITAVFGLGALMLSILMGGLSYFTVRHFLLAGRESAAQQQAFANAVLVRSSLQAGYTQYVGLLADTVAGTDTQAVLYHQSKAYVSSLSVNASSIPRELRKVVLAGTAATQTYRTPAGTAEIVVGVPVPSEQAFYFEVFDLSDLDHTLPRPRAHPLRRRRGDHHLGNRAGPLRQRALAAPAGGRVPGGGRHRRG